MKFSPYVRVNAVAPGIVVDTELAQNLPQEVLELYRSRELIKTPLVPDDVARTVSFLMSDMGRSYTDQSFLPYGPSPTGKLIYTEDGHLAVTLMSSDRSLFASEDISKSTVEEAAAAFSSFDSYSGRWSLDEDTGRVEHIIEAGRIPNWVGKTHVRYCSVEDGCLTLSTEQFSMGDNTWRVYVKWRRPQRRCAANRN